MSNKPYRQCRKQGCRALVNDATGYCITHRQIIAQSFDAYKYADRPSPSRRGYGRKWVEARAAFLRLHPLCALCNQRASCVDHVIPHRGNMQLFWDSDNWQSLCHSCHSAKTLRETNEQKKRMV